MNKDYYMNATYGSPDVISVAISYSRSTKERYNEAIIDIIMGFEDGRTSKDYNVSVFIDRRNIPGDDYEMKIDRRFSQADIIICLVSNNFINHRFIQENERPIIQNFAKRKDKRAIPIIVTRTNFYSETWMGNIKRTTLPNETGVKYPYSSYSNENYPQKLIKDGLDRVFKEFHNEIVKPRTRSRVVNPIIIPKIVFSHKLVARIINSTVLILCILLVYESLSYQEKDIPLIPIDENKLENLNNKDIERTRDRDRHNLPSDYNNNDNRINRNLPGVKQCQSKSSMETSFPRNLSIYPYFGKESYGRYESCQGLNKNGYKPCKKKRSWYIVNELKNQHLYLKVDRETHLKIYAIRPLLDNIAEVYFHDGNDMYLSFCISMDDGLRTE